MFLLPAGAICSGRLQTPPCPHRPTYSSKEGAIRIGYSARVPQPPGRARLFIYRRAAWIVKGCGRGIEAGEASRLRVAGSTGRGRFAKLSGDCPRGE